MLWSKMDNGYDTHPDVVAAGFYGRVVFLALVRINGQFECGGAIPMKYLRPAYIAQRIGLYEELDRDAANTAIVTAIDRCVDVGLLERDGDEMSIPGWANWRPSTSTIRMKRKRERDSSPADGVTCDVTGDALSGSDCDSSVTPDAPVTQDPTERKKERKRDPAAAAAGARESGPAPTHDAHPREATPATGGSGSDGEAGRHPGETTPPKSSTPPWVYYGHVEETDPPDRKSAGVKSLWLELDGSRPNLSMGDDVAIERWVTSWPYKAVLYAVRRALELDGHRIGNRHVSGILQRARPEEWDETAREAAAAAEPQRAAGGARDGAGERACPQSRINASWAEKSAQAPARAAEAMADPNWGVVDPRAGF